MILVAGSANLDLVVRASHIAAPGETVLGRDFQTFPGGKGANQAVACARAGGAPTHMLLALGGDAFAAPLQASLEEAGVEMHLLQVPEQATGTAFICVSDDAQNAITVAPGANFALTEHHLPDLEEFNYLLLQLEIPLPTVLAYARTAHAQGVKVVLNAAPARVLPAELLSMVDILVVNQGELAVVAQHQGSVAECLARLEQVPCVVVTLGQHGCCARADGVLLTQAAFKVRAVDTTGAGDTFCGVLVAALSQGQPLPLALRLASAAGALACTELGAQHSIPMSDAVIDFLLTQPVSTEAENTELRRFCGFELPAAPVPSANKERYKVIYDTDPGVDDAMALYFALAHPAIELLGITTTFGNVTVEQAASNALYLTALAGKTVPVTQGVATPWCKPAQTPPAHIHGADGLGNLPERAPLKTTLDPRTSAQFIVDMARAQPGEITLVAVGPLGNLSLALKLEPRLPQLLRGVILMGGTISEPGNVSPVAEANIWNDPHAADHVFGAGWPLTMVGLDVTHRVLLPSALFGQIAAQHQHPATDTLHHAVRFYADFYGSVHPQLAQMHGCFGHDVLAFVYLVNPELFTLEHGRIRVVTEGLAQGQTMLQRHSTDYPQPGWGTERAPAQVCMQVDALACRALIEHTLLAPWL